MSTFGRDFRRELFRRTSTLAATRLGVVLIDEAYTQGTETVCAGYRYLRRETGLHGRNLERARDELRQAGLLDVEPEGRGVKARTRWRLKVPETSAPERTLEDEASDRASVRPSVRSTARRPADTFPTPDPDTPLTPLKGGVRRRSPDERAAHRFTGGLRQAQLDEFQALAECTQADVVKLYRQTTGLRYARGEAGAGWMAHPLGIDRPGPGDRSQLPPTYRKPAPAEFFDEWREREGFG